MAAAGSESNLAIYGAIVANIAIAVTKFIVAGISGSAAMLSEGIHSTVDTVDGLLLLVGRKRSQRPATPEHPFGHGKELYFWSLIVGVLIFGLGGGISFYEGLLHMRSPEPLHDPLWNYVVLGLAALFEGTSFAIALRQFKRESRGQPFWRALRSSKDPSTFTVVVEDGAALIGLAMAAVGITLSHVLQMPELDGAASVAIGLLLAGVAALLIRESRGLLIGEGLHPESLRAIREIVESHHGVHTIGRLLSMYIGPNEVLLTFDAQFQPDTPARDIAATVRAIEQEVRAHYPMISRIYVETRALGD